MLPPRILSCNRNVCGRCVRRSFSAVPQRYPSKVRAFPFALSKKDAIIHMGIYASKACMFKDFLGSLGARVFGLGLGFTPIQPTRIQPIYIPAWFVDAELEANAWVASDGDTKQQVVTAFLSNSYLPGFVFEPLSRLSFNSKGLRALDPIPFSKDLEKQHKEEILCLPYTASPLSLPEAARSLSFKQATICDHLRLIPSSIKSNFLAAYPVLIPIYLAQYDFQMLDESLSVTLILEAFSRSGRIICEVAPPSVRKFLNLEFVTWRGDDQTSAFAVLEKLMVPLHREHLAVKLGEWMDAMISSPGAAKRVMKTTSVRLDDPRVREFVEDETRVNRNFMTLGTDILALKEVLQKISSNDGTGRAVIQITLNPRLDVDAKALGRGSTQDFVTALEEKRKAIKPQWWTDWESSSSTKKK